MIELNPTQNLQRLFYPCSPRDHVFELFRNELTNKGDKNTTDFSWIQIVDSLTTNDTDNRKHVNEMANRRV
jgi:hypothetical protein